MTVLSRIERDYRIQAACALDSMPLLARRVTNLLSWGRRISIATRWLERDGDIELKAGLRVDEKAGGPRFTQDEGHAHFGVHLTPGIEGFGFGAYAFDSSATEADVWRRYHNSRDRRRDITTIDMAGGGDGQGGPGREDGLTINFWNQYGVGRQIIIAFDHQSYSDAWTERENAGWAYAGERNLRDAPFCREWAQIGPFRVHCGFPVAEGACTGAALHVGGDVR